MSIETIDVSATEVLDGPIGANAPVPAMLGGVPDANLYTGFARDIANVIIKALGDEGDRNFECGRVSLEKLYAYRATAKGFSSKDYDGLVLSTIEQVRAYVNIPTTSIRLDLWTTCHAAREHVASLIGEDATVLDYYEYAVLCRREGNKNGSPRAFVMDKQSLAVKLTDGWIDFIKNVVNIRKTSEDRNAIGSEDFNRMVDEHKQMLANAITDPVAAARAIAEAAAKKRELEKKKVRTKVSDGINSAIAEGIFTAQQIIEETKQVAKLFNQPVPEIGLGPNEVSEEAIKTWVLQASSCKNWKGLRALHQTIGEMLSARETMRTAKRAAAESTPTVKMADLQATG